LTAERSHYVMKRRESLKTMLAGALGGAALAAVPGCKTEPKTSDSIVDTSTTTEGYGRTPAELAHDEKVNQSVYLTAYEMGTIAVLCDIILPATKEAGSATDAKVPEFIDFIVKDLPRHQLPIRGGLMWLDSEANRRYNKTFTNCTQEEEIAIIDDIAYPDPDHKKPEMGPGISFFNLMRNLTLTGYYTTKMGFDDLKVNSNYANVWDGVPAEVLAKHDVAYEEEWLAKCVNQDKRNDIAEWDEAGNLVT
jgi:Gluconate 2-dehydrogenase subunit 3